MAEGFLMRKITGVGGSMQTISELPENPEINKLYYYPNSSIGDSIVFFNESWKSISVGGFPIERMLYAGDILAASVKQTGTPDDAISLEDRIVTIDGISFTKAIKVYGKNLHNINYGIELLGYDFKGATGATLYYGVSCEQADKLKIYTSGGTDLVIKGNNSSEVTGTANFITASTVRINYSKDNSVSKADDAIFIYGIKFSGNA